MNSNAKVQDIYRIRGGKIIQTILLSPSPPHAITALLLITHINEHEVVLLIVYSLKMINSPYNNLDYREPLPHAH